MVSAQIKKSMYESNFRKYIDVQINSEILHLKIPFRYGRVMCRMGGLKTVHELKEGDIVDVEFSKKVWDGIEFLVLDSATEC